MAVQGPGGSALASPGDPAKYIGDTSLMSGPGGTPWDAGDGRRSRSSTLQEARGRSPARSSVTWMVRTIESQPCPRRAFTRAERLSGDAEWSMLSWAAPCRSKIVDETCGCAGSTTADDHLHRRVEVPVVLRSYLEIAIKQQGLHCHRRAGVSSEPRNASKGAVEALRRRRAVWRSPRRRGS